VVVKQIVCLANSRKLSGRCVAGKEWPNDGSGSWIRPVSSRPSEEVSEYERQYQDGTDPRVLDVIDVPLIEHRPHTYQSENWLLDAEQYWVRRGRATLAEVADAVDAPPELWSNDSSSYNGRLDRVSLEQANALSGSLYLLGVSDLTVHVFAPGAYFGNPKRRVQGRFSHRGLEYHLWITDPRVTAAYLVQSDGTYEIGESFITVSLGEPYEDGYCYKLIAAIIAP
jgi:Dual OB-containing domain